MDIYTREREHRMISGHTSARSLIAKLKTRDRISPAERTSTRLTPLCCIAQEN